MDWMRKDLRQSGAARNASRGNRGALFNFTNPRNLFSDAAGSVPVVDGDGIYWARDLSGNNNDISQATSGSRPTWSVNGYAAFDGTADHLFRASDLRFAENGVICEAWTAMFMVKTNTSGTSDTIMSLGDTSGGTSFAWNVMANSTTASSISVFIRDNSSANAIPASTALGTGFFDGNINVGALTIEGTEAASRFTPYLNGTRQARVTVSSYAGTHTANCFTIGARKRGTIDEYMPMNLYHIMLIDRILSHSEIIAIEQEWRREARV